jgi:hypothetical protein
MKTFLLDRDVMEELFEDLGMIDPLVLIKEAADSPPTAFPLQ